MEYFNHNNTKRWIDVLPSFVDNYKNSYHRSFKMKLIEASSKGNENNVYTNLFSHVKFQKRSIRKFNVGDLVIINKSKGVFYKDYLPNYTTEVFQIVAVKPKTSIAYELSDKTGELIIGSFYEKELSKAFNKTFIL